LALPELKTWRWAGCAISLASPFSCGTGARASRAPWSRCNAIAATRTTETSSLGTASRQATRRPRALSIGRLPEDGSEERHVRSSPATKSTNFRHDGMLHVGNLPGRNLVSICDMNVAKLVIL